MMYSQQRGERLLAAVARLNRWASHHSHIEVPTAQARLLALVESIGPARISELAAADHSSQPTMTTQVQRVEASGWVTRRSDPNDARAWLVDLTDSGRQVLRDARAARAEALAPLLETLDDEALEVLDRATLIMERMVRPPT